MNLNELKQAGGFIEDAPVKVPVKWNGHAFDVWVKQLSFGDVESLMAGDDERSKTAKMLAASVLLGDKKEPLTYDDAYRLAPALATELIKAVNNANGSGDGDSLPN